MTIPQIDPIGCDLAKRADFRTACWKAAAADQETFEFDGRQFVVADTMYQLGFLDGYMDGINDSTKT